MNNTVVIERWIRLYSVLHRDFEFVAEISTSGHHRITQRSTATGRHFARHTSYTLREAGKPDRNLPLSDATCRQILDQLEAKGDTECFIIDDAHGGADSLRPEDIRHIKTHSESSYTATGEKLAHHWPIFKKYSDTGFGSIIRATLTNHQVCSSSCQFCSTIARNRSDSVSLQEAIDFVDALYFGQEKYNEEHFPEYNQLYREATGSGIRLKGLILSGGGQPNLWPHFEKFVEYLATLDIDLGLITNGFPPKVAEDVYRHFQWIRISVTPPEASAFYPDGDFRRQYIPQTVGQAGQTVGLSYVYGPWSSSGDLAKIDGFVRERDFGYVRVLTDCNLTRSEQLWAHQDLSEKLLAAGLIDVGGKPLSKTFHQLKYHATQEEADEVWHDGQCKLQVYSAFWDTTGHDENGHSYIFPCDSVTVLAEGGGKLSERKFNHERWGTYRNTDVDKLFTQPLHNFFDPREECGSCLFLKNNITANDIIRNPVAVASATKPDHINFP
jgi:hypothetical protein